MSNYRFRQNNNKKTAFKRRIRNNKIYNKQIEYERKNRVDKMIKGFKEKQKLEKQRRKNIPKKAGFSIIPSYSKPWVANRTLDRFLKWMSPVAGMALVDLAGIAIVFAVKEMSKIALFLGGITFPKIILFSAIAIGCVAGFCFAGFLIHTLVVAIKEKGLSKGCRKNYRNFKNISRTRNISRYNGKGYRCENYRKSHNVGCIGKEDYNHMTNNYDKYYDNFYKKSVLLGKSYDKNDRDKYHYHNNNQKQFNNEDKYKNTKVSSDKQRYYKKDFIKNSK